MKKALGIKSLGALLMAAALVVCANMSFAAKTFSGVVNINTASPNQLEEIPGIGPAKANAIVEYRTNSPFKSTEEIKEVKGIGDKLYAKISPYLTVSGETRIGGADEARPGSGARVKK